MSAGNMVTGRKTVQSVGAIATVMTREVTAAGPPHTVPQVMAGAATEWPHLQEMITWVALRIVRVVMWAVSLRPLVGSVATALSWGIDMEADQQPPLLTGHQLMIVTVFIAVLTIMRSTELGPMAQAISRIVACLISPLPHPPPSSLSKLSSGVDPYDRRPPPPPVAAASAAAYYAQDRNPIGRVPVSSAGYTYERTRLSPVSSRSTYATPRPKDHYAPRYAPY